MLNSKQLRYLKKNFPDFVKSYRIIIKKTEAGKVVTCERLCIKEKKTSDTMLKTPRNLKKVGTK